MSIQCNIAPCFFGALYVDLPGVGTFLFPGDSAPRSWTGQVKTEGVTWDSGQHVADSRNRDKTICSWSWLILPQKNHDIWRSKCFYFHTMLYAFDILLMPWKNIQTFLIQISDPDFWSRWVALRKTNPPSQSCLQLDQNNGLQHIHIFMALPGPAGKSGYDLSYDQKVRE